MWWTPAQTDALDSALEAAARGETTLLTLEGMPGVGKTALMRELVRRARIHTTRFTVLRAEGEEETQQQPLGLLDQVGELGGLDTVGSGFQGAQRLRMLIDRLDEGPLLLAIDDLQWLDHQSVQALTALLRRAFGDRLLVAAASRPIEPPAHPQWRKLLLEDEVRRIHLTGLGLDETRGLVHAQAPMASEALVRRLRQHTDGNPLYLRAILSEHAVDDLEDMNRPTPLDIAERIADHLRALAPDAATLASAVAVIGPDWTPLNLAADVAEIDNAATTLGVLVDAELLQQRRRGPHLDVRVSHALVHSFIYDQTSVVLREELHRRAATHVTSPRDRLRHLVAAAPGYDDNLARDLEAYAVDLYDRGRFLEAARFLAWASATSSDPVERERVWLDSLFAQMLGGDLQGVEEELTEVAWASAGAQRAVVQAFHLMVMDRLSDALAVLNSVTPAQLQAATPLAANRWTVLHGWMAMLCGAEAEGVVEALASAREMETQDAALTTFAGFGLLSAALVLTTETRDWGVPNPYVTENSALLSNEMGTVFLHGAYYATAGRLDEAVRDLATIKRAIGDGVLNFETGLVHAQLGLALWLGRHGRCFRRVSTGP